MNTPNSTLVTLSPVARASSVLRDRWLTLVGTLLAVLAFATPAIVPWLEYRRDLPAEVWRLFTCHWTHFDLDHLLWSGSMFALLAAMLEPRGRRRLLLCILTSAFAVPIAVHVANPDFTTYRGLSGIDSALFVLLLLDLVREARAEHNRPGGWLYAALGAGFVAKLAFEFCSGGTVFASAANYDAVPLAHLVGAAVGAAFGVRPRADLGCPYPCDARKWMMAVQWRPVPRSPRSDTTMP